MLADRILIADARERLREELPCAYGRFSQPDPIGYDGDGPNLYAYALNDPVNRSDPVGLQNCEGTNGNEPQQECQSQDGAGAIVVTGTRPSAPSVGDTFRPSLPGSVIGGPSDVNAGSPIVVTGRRPRHPSPASELPIVITGPHFVPTLPVQISGVGLTLAGFSNDGSDEEYERDLQICRGLASPAARARCFGTAEARRYARENGKPLPPLITWRNGALVTSGIILYWVVSEGSRILFPPRNLIPVP